MGDEKKTSKQVVLRKYVTINGSLKAMGLDLNEGGIYVHTGASFKTGTLVDLLLPLDEEAVKVKARVQDTQEGVGMGLTFVGLGPMERACIRGFIDDSSADQSIKSKKKVLIVDDNAVTRRMNRSKLVLDGFEVLEATDGVEAIGVLEGQTVHLVVLDLYMEKLDGYKVLALMRQRPEWKDIPVLVFSARSSPEEVGRAINAGATEFLVKMTTTPARLSDRVKKHLSTK
jgi:two-component system chemotaxis response regulator CheY